MSENHIKNINDLLKDCPIWNKPSLIEEHEEIVHNAKELNLHAGLIRKAFKQGNLIVLSNNIWEQLENTESYSITSIDEAKSIAQKYEKDWESIDQAFFHGSSLPAPIVLEVNEKYYLIAGNTRLIFAKAYHCIPKIFLLKYEDNYSTLR